MALAVFLRGNKLPVLANAASKLMATKTLNSSLVLTPIVARNFTALNNRPALLEKKSILGSQIPQNRQMNHATIWAAEKILSAALLGIIPICVAFPSPMLDNVLAVSVVVHMHWGVESVVVDYIRPSLFHQNTVIPTIAHWFTYLLTAISLGGMIYFNYNDIGLAKGVRRLWQIKGV